jgi:hypothetical protein
MALAVEQGAGGLQLVVSCGEVSTAFDDRRLVWPRQAVPILELIAGRVAGRDSLDHDPAGSERAPGRPRRIAALAGPAPGSLSDEQSAIRQPRSPGSAPGQWVLPLK